MPFKSHIKLINIVVVTGKTGNLRNVEEMQCKYHALFTSCRAARDIIDILKK